VKRANQNVHSHHPIWPIYLGKQLVNLRPDRSIGIEPNDVYFLIHLCSQLQRSSRGKEPQGRTFVPKQNNRGPAKPKQKRKKVVQNSDNVPSDDSDEEYVPWEDEVKWKPKKGPSRGRGGGRGRGRRN